ncbi:MAG: response regulator [Pseudomonadota bacterium]
MSHLSVATVPSQKPTSAPSAPIRVLILDDNEFDTRRIKRTLKRVEARLDVTSVRTLTEFYRAILSKQYDVLIIDYFLPDGDGLTALRMASDHANASSFASIMVAGEHDPAIAEAAKGFGCEYYLAKSDLDADVLRNALNKALAKTLDSDLMALRGLFEASPSQALNDVARNVVDPLRPYLMRLTRASRVLRSLSDLDQNDILTQASIEIEHSCEAAIELLNGFETIRLDHSQGAHQP